MQCNDRWLTPGVAASLETLARAIRIAGELARRARSAAVRVDFLLLHGKLVFGELTFTAAACTHFFLPRAIDYLLGDAASAGGNTISSACFGSIVGLLSCDEGLRYSAQDHPACPADYFDGTNTTNHELRSIARHFGTASRPDPFKVSGAGKVINGRAW